MPSLYEASPLALLEANACGVPAAVFGLPWTKEFVTQGENGRTAKPFDAEELAEGMLECVRMGVSKRSSILRTASRFTVEEMIRKMISLYASIA